MQTVPSGVPSPASGGTADMLPRERAGASFAVEDLERLLYGKNGALSSRTAPFEKLFDREPFNDEDMDNYRSYEGQWRHTMKRTSTAIELVRNSPKLMATHMRQGVSMRELFPTGALGIHFSMFLTFIKTQASPEQQKRWLGLAQEGGFFGAYCQTELGHGSNLRGLETVATYDKATQEFVIHSPTLTSLKWWPTGMYSCTHAAVMANLYLEGKNLGFHGFMVQLRDDQGRCMPGVEIGEMGPKINFNSTNIGYGRFTHVRIPRENMFARAQQVTPEGEYVKPKSAAVGRFKYISMMEIRVAFVADSARTLAKAATIAIRYSCVRHQGYRDNEDMGRGERKVLDYKMQQYRLFKALALAYMFHWNANYIRQYLEKVREGMMKGDEAAASDLPYLHATLCGFKVFSTVTAQANMEECRKACGGQGFLRSSGVADLPPNFGEQVTAEGEQVILSQQLSRFLVKEIRRVRSGKPAAGMAAYLNDKPMAPLRLASYAGAVPDLLRVLRNRACKMATKLEAAFSAAERPGETFEATLNRCAVLGWKAAEAHTMYVFLLNNQSVLEGLPASTVRDALVRLLELACLQHVREGGAEFVDVLDESQFDLILERTNALLDEIRPDAVALVDGWMFPDKQLKSTLGRYDGNVYEAIYEEAKKSPLNKAEVMLGWEGFSKILDMDFLKQGMKEQRAGAPSKL